jgi:RND family efflux transporter MFP subunit
MQKNTYKQKIGLACVAALSIGLFGCNQENQQSQQQYKMPVDVVKATTMDVPVSSSLIGRTVSVKSAEVRPQVTGIILKRMFTEGSEVKEGQQLYQIDPAIYEANLESAKASLASAQASLSTTKLRYDRYSELIKTKAISQQDYDDAKANYLTAQAGILNAQAQVHTAEINLAYTKVYAPISGIIGRSSVTEGALVTTGQASPLATIQQLDPMYIDLGISASSHLLLEREALNGEFIPEEVKTADIYFENGSKYEHKAKLEFTEVNVDQSTGMLITRLSVPNPNHLLLPGMYINAKLAEGTRKNSVVIPQIAVLRQTNGTTIVYTATKKDCPEGVEWCVGTQQIETSGEIGNQYIVSSGVSEGDQIIISNVQKIHPKAPIQIVLSEQKPLDTKTK